MRCVKHVGTLADLDRRQSISNKELSLKFLTMLGLGPIFDFGREKDGLRRLFVFPLFLF
jgi:hypothetical protein